MAQRKKWVIRADTPNVPHRLLSTTTFLFLRDLKCWHKTSFFSNHSDNGLQLLRSFFCFCGDFSFSFFSPLYFKNQKVSSNWQKKCPSWSTSSEEDFFCFFSKNQSSIYTQMPSPLPNHHHPRVRRVLLSLVLVEFEVEAATGLERVEVERPALSSASTLLVFRVQGILACVKLLPHF